MKKLMLVLVLLALLVVPSTALAEEPNSVWYVPGNFATIQDAINDSDVLDGDTIRVGPGNFAGALVTKSVTIKGEDLTVIDDGPVHGSGLIQGFRLLAGSDDATLSHLTFDEVDLAIMNGAAVNDVTVTHCLFNNAIQAVSNWRGSGWEISHNTITDLRTRNGGGIGILIADYTGGTVSDNVVTHNNVSGILHVDPNDGGGYNGSGIVLYADFRWGWAGAEEISRNLVVKNKVSLVSDTPDVVDVAAFELSESYYPNPHPGPGSIVTIDNSIGFNDFRGTALQITLTPEELDNHNDISRNLGDNRGHGLHPSLFSPDG
jgi:hypothetical protein